jgi:ubiquinone/menaquinone biosynthesis C-methylase UbiE
MATLVAATRKPYAGMQMEGPMARWYAHITRGRKDHRANAQAIAAQLPGGGDVLEAAPGPGYLAIELARLGDYRIRGLDISRSLVKIARDNARRAGLTIDFQHGDVARMPFASDVFDFAVCVAAFKNFPDPVAALDEIHRVLRPGAKALIFDMRKDAPSDAIEQEIRDMGIRGPSAMLTRLIFRYGLLRAAYTRERLASVVARSRFGSGQIVASGVQFELRLTK